MGSMPIEVPFPGLDRIVFNDPVSSVYVGTYVNYETEVFDKANMKREESKVSLASSNTDIADLDLYGNLVAKKAGKITLTASVENIKETINYLIKLLMKCLFLGQLHLNLMIQELHVYLRIL